MKKEYRKRRDTLLELLPFYFGDNIQVYGAAAGMHIVVKFCDISFTEDILSRLLRCGVYIVPVEAHSLIKKQHEHEIILGYAGLSKEALTQGLDMLKQTCFT